jgi:hypothetical protein
MTVPPDLKHHLAELRHDGPRRFARWDAALFDAVVAGPAKALAQGIAPPAKVVPVLAAYLRLVQEAVGTGAVRQAGPSAAGWTTFLERCLVQLVPERLPRVDPEQQVPLLVKLWNLGEGLRREPEWVDRYVSACADGLKSLAEVEAFLVKTLEPVLTPLLPASWKGPFAVTVLDLRRVHDEFLPGPMHLAAPTVVRVRDRRHPDLQIGVLLRRERKSEVLGLTQGLGEYGETDGHPAVGFDDQRLQLAGQAVELPLFRRCAHHAVARAGFVVACAVDSQRLWVVESP